MTPTELCAERVDRDTEARPTRLLNIAYCHNRYQQTSGEDIACDYALHLLREAGHKVSLFSRNNREIAQFGWPDKLLFPGCTVYSPKTTREAARFLREHRPDVAMVQNVFPLISPSIYHALGKAGVPVVQMVFNYRLFCANGLLFTEGQICERCLGGNHLHAVLHRCFRDSYALSAIYAASLGVHRLLQTWRRHVTLFVTPDEFLKSKLVTAGLDADKICVVSNPFDSSTWMPSFDRAEYALFVGRLIRPKGVLTLLDASLQTEGLPLVIAGDGDQAENVRSHPALAEGKARWVGPVYGEDFNRFMADAAFVVVPSEWYDNLPMIVCQAFACGKPVIASGINGIPEFVKHEENGLLFPAGDAHALSAAMSRLCREPELRRKLAHGARHTAETRFSPALWQRNLTSVLCRAVELNQARSTA